MSALLYKFPLNKRGIEEKVTECIRCAIAPSQSLLDNEDHIKKGLGVFDLEIEKVYIS